MQDSGQVSGHDHLHQGHLTQAKAIAKDWLAGWLAGWLSDTELLWVGRVGPSWLLTLLFFTPQVQNSAGPVRHGPNHAATHDVQTAGIMITLSVQVRSICLFALEFLLVCLPAYAELKTF